MWVEEYTEEITEGAEACCVAVTILEPRDTAGTLSSPCWIGTVQLALSPGATVPAEAWG